MTTKSISDELRKMPLWKFMLWIPLWMPLVSIVSLSMLLGMLWWFVSLGFRQGVFEMEAKWNPKDQPKDSQ
jgi:hypothetical protein